MTRATQKVVEDTSYNEEEEIFELSMQPVKVKLKSADGQLIDHEIRDMDGDTRGAYFNAMSKRSKRNETGAVIGLTDFRGIDAELLIRCLYNVAEERYVTFQEVLSWGGAAASKLAKRAKQVCAIADGTKEAAKNS